ncbi:unnamed protein product [Durusdinium trenchii]|uniref:Uncharacterized protein n=1 Tax=Durusdinium trenchii TaxID=1381693 RepID=A0ABP0LTN0_9DINO
MPGTFYRWSEDQTRALLNCLDMQKLLKKRRKPADGGAEEVDVLDGLMAEVLEELKIPDAYGCWRPRSTKRHIMTGDRPTAPLPIRGTTATLTKAVWVRQLQKDDNGGFKFVSNAFQIDPAPSNIASGESNSNGMSTAQLQTRAASLGDHTMLLIPEWRPSASGTIGHERKR